MKIAIIRSETPITVQKRELAVEDVRKQLPADWTVVFMPYQMSADFLEIIASDDPGKITVASSFSYPPKEILTHGPSMQHNPQAQGCADMFRARFDEIFGASKPPAPPEPPPTRHIKDGKEADASKAETEAWADRVRDATGRGLTVIGRANGAPPKVMNGNYETGKSIGMYAHWIAANPSAQCDHEFVGKIEPGAFLTCLYCHRSRRLPDAKE